MGKFVWTGGRTDSYDPGICHVRIILSVLYLVYMVVVSFMSISSAALEFKIFWMSIEHIFTVPYTYRGYFYRVAVLFFNKHQKKNFN